MSEDTAAHLAPNRAMWNSKAAEYAQSAQRLWPQAEITWGIRGVAEADVEVLDLAELRAPADATTRFGFVDADWASRWPSEQIRVARPL